MHQDEAFENIIQATFSNSMNQCRPAPSLVCTNVSQLWVGCEHTSDFRLAPSPCMVKETCQSNSMLITCRRGTGVKANFPSWIAGSAHSHVKQRWMNRRALC